jgi:hypothetical protein
MAYSGRNERREWGLALSSAAQGSLIDIVGASFFPLYRVVGPMIFFLSLMLLVWGGLRLMVTILERIVVIVRCKGCGLWVLTALWGNFVPAGNIAFQLDGRGHGRSWSPCRADDGDRGSSGAGGGEAKEEKSEHRRPQEEVLVVAKWGRQGRAARPPHRRGSRRRGWCYLARSQEH